ncbi:MAG: amidase [Alphaproteobacteria bacterium]|jgi:aspartyl-tRNA(Asn)/glutamyl-tRNA(Gln) amidotransferase subunit A|nr:amidase [Alphaproteobacteria bacterium]
MDDGLEFPTVAALLQAFGQGRLTPEAATEAALARIGATEPALNAFQLVDEDGARQAANASALRWAEGRPLGPLDGIPLTIKDIVATKGWPTLSGSLTEDSNGPWEEDAPAVARLREAGAVILGKTTTPEFGWKGMTDSPLAGITRNPWNTAHTPGGSSGGAAASLAAGVGAIAYGTDGGGSIRIPSNYCGLYGIKPTYGRVPHAPNDRPFSTLSCGGPIARTVTDAALFLNIIAQPDDRDWRALPPDGRDYRIGLEDGVRGLRLAYAPNLGGAEAAPEVLAATERAVRLFTDLGASVDNVGEVIAPLRPRFEAYWLAGFATRVRGMSEEKRALLDPDFRALAEAGLDVGIGDYLQGEAERSRLGAQFAAFHRDYDLLLTPTQPTLPPTVETRYHSAEFDRWRHAAPFTVPFNLTGQPAASIPCGVSNSGLPIGLQIVGPRFADHLVLRASRAFEAASQMPQPHPRLGASVQALMADN